MKNKKRSIKDNCFVKTLTIQVFRKFIYELYGTTPFKTTVSNAIRRIFFSCGCIQQNVNSFNNETKSILPPNKIRYKFKVDILDIKINKIDDVILKHDSYFNLNDVTDLFELEIVFKVNIVSNITNTSFVLKSYNATVLTTCHDQNNFYNLCVIVHPKPILRNKNISLDKDKYRDNSRNDYYETLAHVYCNDDMKLYNVNNSRSSYFNDSLLAKLSIVNIVSENLEVKGDTVSNLRNDILKNFLNNSINFNKNGRHLNDGWDNAIFNCMNLGMGFELFTQDVDSYDCSYLFR